LHLPGAQRIDCKVIKIRLTSKSTCSFEGNSSLCCLGKFGWSILWEKPISLDPSEYSWQTSAGIACLLAAPRYFAAVKGLRGQQRSGRRVWWKPQQIWREPRQSHRCVLRWEAHHNGCLIWPRPEHQGLSQLPGCWKQSPGVRRRVCSRSFLIRPQGLIRTCSEAASSSARVTVCTEVPAAAAERLQVLLPAAVVAWWWSTGWCRLFRGCVVIRRDGSACNENAENPLPVWRRMRCLLTGGSRSLVGVGVPGERKNIS